MSWGISFPGGIVVTWPGHRLTIKPFTVSSEAVPPVEAELERTLVPRGDQPIPDDAELILNACGDIIGWWRLPERKLDPLPYTRPVRGWWRDEQTFD